MPETQLKRDAARKMNVKEILEAEAISTDYGTALDDKGALAKRISLIATIVDKSPAESAYAGLLVDDGTGRVWVRIFDDSAILKNADIGSLLLVIGKPRRYGEETYISPEITRRIANLRWAEVRRLELKTKQPEETSKARTEAAENSSRDAISREKGEIYQLIRELDKGTGVDMTDVTEKAIRGADILIKEMLSKGDLFEVTPGKLKILQ